MPDATDLAATLRNERHRRGFTLAEVASMCEVGTPHISKIETGVEQPSVALLERLADWWKLDLVALLVLAGRVHPAVATALERGAAAEAVVALGQQLNAPLHLVPDASQLMRDRALFVAYDAALAAYDALTEGKPT